MAMQLSSHMLTRPPALAPPCIPCITLYPPRDVRAYGRNDGYSKARKKDRRKKQERRREEPSPSGFGGAWWEDGDQPQTSQPQPRQQRQQSSSRYEDRRQRRDREEQPTDETGWWQKPGERSLQAYAPSELSPRQVRRLEEAFAVGRRKIKISELAEELGLDRSEVIHWMKEFQLRPDSEREAIIAQRKEEMQRAAAQALNEPRSLDQQASPRGAAPARSGRDLLQQQQGPPSPQGFIPFYTRKEMGMTEFTKRRLSADAVRTLETIYSRNPFPSDDVIRGMWDLHRVNRETTLQWLTARREQDGVVSNSSRSRQDASAMTPAQLRQAMGNVGFDGNNLMVQISSEDRASPGDSDQPSAGDEAPQEPRVVKVTGRQLALIKSSLPSPNKRKGKERNEKMGIKSEADSMLVGNIQYVKAERPTYMTSKWAAVWRHQKAVRQRKVLPLLLETGPEQQ